MMSYAAIPFKQANLPNNIHLKLAIVTHVASYFANIFGLDTLWGIKWYNNISFTLHKLYHTIVPYVYDIKIS